jgi:periplasmic divalent cation tolerance protein
MTELCVVYITASNTEEAVKIAEMAVNERLAACANIIDNMTAIYRWEGKIQKDNEAVLLLKTKSSLFSELEKAVRAIHSYVSPCIVSIPISDASESYAEWLISQTRQ